MSLTVKELAAATRSLRTPVTLPGISCESRKALEIAKNMPVLDESREQLHFANILAGRA